MIEQLDQKTKERVNKAIGNIRLIASRSKRAQVLDASQRAEVVVGLLNDFRQYLNINVIPSLVTDAAGRFKHDAATLERVKDAINEAGNIFAALSHSKQVSYKEEYKQVWLLLVDVQTYVEKMREEDYFDKVRKGL